MNPSISPIKVLLGTIGYLLVTFPLAFVWQFLLGGFLFAWIYRDQEKPQ